MTQLTKTQTALIENAISRDDGALLPAPKGIADKAMDRALAGLVRKGFAMSAALTGGEPEDGAGYILTEAGRVAVTSEEAPAPEDAITAPPARPGGKLGAVLKAVERKRGATLAELVDATGWQPHTARAALTRLRQRGFPAVLTEEGARKSYRLQG